MDRAKKTFAYVGANTTPERAGKAKGIRVYQIDGTSGDWDLTFQTEDINPGFLAFNHGRDTLYCTHANHIEVSAYHMDGMEGSLRLLNRRPLGGYNGTHLCVSYSGNFLLVAAASSATIAVFPILADQSLGPICDSFSPIGNLGPLRTTEQPNAMPHQILPDCGGRFMFAPDRGEDRVHTLYLDEKTGKLKQVTHMRTREARTPRHMCFLHSMKKAYVLTEFSSTVVCCDYDEDTGKLSPFQVVSALPEEFVGLFNKGAEIAIHPNERFLYVSNRGHNSLAIFAIEPGSGLLTSVGWQNTYGDVPRFFMIEEGGHYLYVANEKSDTIISFAVNGKSGRLIPTGQVISTPTPTCILLSGSVPNIASRDVQLREVIGEYKVFTYSK